MKSTGGQHFVTLDHVRAVAAFLVFAWHFGSGVPALPGPIPAGYLPALFPFAILDEGHVGVAVFMTLSGYLFARLLSGKSVQFLPFIYNRALRLLPLLVLVAVIAAAVLQTRWGVTDLSGYWREVAAGWIRPTLPNGGWSITVEAHFYLALPVLLAAMARSPKWALAFIGIAIAARLGVNTLTGNAMSLSYYTILGRLDQFVAGMLVCRYRDIFRGNLRAAVWSFVTLAVAYWFMDRAGGIKALFNAGQLNPAWLLMPTLEGAACAAVIAWYDTSSRPTNGPISRAVAYVGELSYSMYLLHVFFVFDMAVFARRHLPMADNFYVAMAWALVCFVALLPLAAVSYHFIERPFLRLRRPYLIGRARERDAEREPIATVASASSTSP